MRMFNIYLTDKISKGIASIAGKVQSMGKITVQATLDQFTGSPINFTINVKGKITKFIFSTTQEELLLELSSVPYLHSL